MYTLHPLTRHLVEFPSGKRGAQRPPRVLYGVVLKSEVRFRAKHMIDKNYEKLLRDQVLTLNVGGTLYTTTRTTLEHNPDSYLAKLLTNSSALRDVNHNLFIDRDPSLFRYILDYCRYGKLCIPRNFDELERLKEEASFYELNKLVDIISREMEPRYSCVTVGYRGTFSASRDGSTDLRFRKLARILVAGQTAECRRLFGDTLNDTRDPDTGTRGEKNNTSLRLDCLNGLSMPSSSENPALN
ncbi:K+ channel tetramerization domain protein, partial [Opisthorchis viverrini]